MAFELSMGRKKKKKNQRSKQQQQGTKNGEDVDDDLLYRIRNKEDEVEENDELHSRDSIERTIEKPTKYTTVYILQVITCRVSVFLPSLSLSPSRTQPLYGPVLLPTGRIMDLL